MNRPQLYQQLLHNEAQLRFLWGCEGLEQFVRLMADFLHWPELEFQQLLVFLREQNQQLLQPDLELFSRCWFPYAYKRAGQQLLWIPAFQKPEQPFLEDDLVSWRQSLLAQLIRPVTQLQPLLAQLQNLPVVQPQLLIFHWSRCGSTLVSGCLMLEPELNVLSESMLISDVLQDPELSPYQAQCLDLLVRLQGRFRHQEQQLVIKCNAWDLQHWRLWTHVFPESRLLGLIRQPEAILASHQRVSGRHMVRQPPELWSGIQQGLSLLQYRVEVIRQMADFMLQLQQEKPVLVLDYRQLVATSATELATLLGIQLDEPQSMAWQKRRTMDAKARQTVFIAAPQDPATQFTAQEQQLIRERLHSCYQLLSGQGLA
ncbi:hypothetical protein [Rheinheimera sp.]|uniref:hypothetical protein n=1 Tax=Rheinheimera sp. TaxID=1869214 RepID=UPI00307D7615